MDTEILTAGQLRRILSNFPEYLPVMVSFDGKMVVTASCGDRIEGDCSDIFAVYGVTAGEVFEMGRGFLPTVQLHAGDT